MAESSPPATGMKPTLGVTGLTSNAMALIAPGAFLWLTFGQQSLYGNPAAGSAMWLGIVFALLLCLATAVSYAELSKLYPGAGSSYFFAEQAFLSKKQAYKWARLYKFAVGWASHLYYWVYPGVMVCVTAIFIGYMAGQIWPGTFSTSMGSPLLMVLFCVAFSFGVSYISFIGVQGATGVNVAINIIQISALLIFSIMAIMHRAHYTEGTRGAWNLDSNGHPTQFVQDTIPDTTKTIPDPKDATGKTMIQDPNATVPKTTTGGDPIWVYIVADANGKPVLDSKGNETVVPTNPDGTPTAKPAVPQMTTISYLGGMVQDPKTKVWTFNYHDTATSVIHWHNPFYVFIQACVAILILVGFESVTAMGEEAKNAKRDIPIAVIAALVIQGGFCYLFEYFAANYFQSSLYTNTTASGSSAPIGDMMQLVGAWWWGSASMGWWFMFWQAVTVFLAMVGTTLSCINTGARVTYAMGRDEEVPAHFGMLHGKNVTPHRCIWLLACISAVIGIVGVMFYLCGPAATFSTSALDTAHQNSIWFKGAFLDPAVAKKIPNSLLTITLISNFGTFMLYMMTCLVAMVAFHEHHLHHPLKHVLIPLFGLLANLACMIFYVVGPLYVAGMSPQEPFIALGVAFVWGLYGYIYFVTNSKKTGKSILVQAPPTAAVGA